MKRIIFIILGGLLLSLQAQTYSREVEFSGGDVRVVASQNLPKDPRLALVLSGGGSRGLVHIGALKVLEENGIYPDIIVGTSIGSVAGGLFSAGYSAVEIEEIVHDIKWDEIFTDKADRTALFLGQKPEQDRHLFSLRLRDWKPVIPNALTPGQRVLDVLSDLFLRAPLQVQDSFDDLRFRFRSVATDIVSGKMVVLEDGNIAKAINGSLAVPLLFSPVERDGMMLVDGGIKSNLPVQVARDLQADYVIAVDVSSVLRSREQIEAPWEVADQVTTIMTNGQNLEGRRLADVVILPDVPKVTNTDFSQIDSVIMAGETATRQNLEKIRRLIALTPHSGDSTLQIGRIDFSSNSRYSALPDSAGLSGDSLSLSRLNSWMRAQMDRGPYKKIVARYAPESAVLSVQADRFALLDTVLVSGNTRISSSVLQDSMKLVYGQPPTAGAIKDALRRLTSLYHIRGYALTNIRNVTFDERSGALYVHLEEGRIDDIAVSGNEKTKDYVILREFSMLRGNVFNWNQVSEAIRNVYASQFFSRVSADIVHEGGRNRLVVQVQEKPSVRLQIGGLASLERRFMGYLELGDENFMGRGVKAKLATMTGVRDGYFGLQFRSDRIFTSYITFTAEGYFSYEVNTINKTKDQSTRYREERLGIRLQLGQQLRRIGQLAGYIRAENVKDFRVSGPFNFGSDIHIRALGLGSVTDKRDRIAFPRNGIYNYWFWENGNSFLLNSEESFTKIGLNLEGYYTFAGRHTWHLRFFSGLGDLTLPFSEQFRLGGLHSFYGFLENEIFGRRLLSSHIEYRYRIPSGFSDIYLSARYDIGAAWSESGLEINADDLFSGYGGYIGMETFLGPFYLGWGKNTMDRETLYLSIGHRF